MHTLGGTYQHQVSTAKARNMEKFGNYLGASSNHFHSSPVSKIAVKDLRFACRSEGSTNPTPVSSNASVASAPSKSPCRYVTNPKYNSLSLSESTAQRSHPRGSSKVAPSFCTPTKLQKGSSVCDGSNTTPELSPYSNNRKSSNTSNKSDDTDEDILQVTLEEPYQDKDRLAFMFSWRARVKIFDMFDMTFNLPNLVPTWLAFSHHLNKSTISKRLLHKSWK